MTHGLGRYASAILLSLVVSGLFAAFEISPVLLQQIQSKYGTEAVTRIQNWQKLIATNQALSDQDKLILVNRFFNDRIEFIDDIYLWREEDYWATPVEFLSKGAGDCEDYSIAKYFTLLELGVSEEKMRITYVKALNLNQAHMVLTYFETPRSVPVVLDNLIPQIKPATERRDLLPVYSFNGSGLFLAKARGSGKKVGGANRLNMWNQLKERMLNNAY